MLTYFVLGLLEIQASFLLAIGTRICLHLFDSVVDKATTMTFNPFLPPNFPGGYGECIIDPDDAMAMLQYNLILPPSTDGMIRVSSRRLRAVRRHSNRNYCPQR